MISPGVQRVRLSGVKRIYITGEYIRLDALLKFASIAATGGEAKIMIQDGEVFVDHIRCTQRGKKVRPGEVVRYGRGADVRWLIVTQKNEEAL